MPKNDKTETAKQKQKQKARLCNRHQPYQHSHAHAHAQRTRDARNFPPPRGFEPTCPDYRYPRYTLCSSELEVSLEVFVEGLRVQGQQGQEQQQGYTRQQQQDYLEQQQVQEHTRPQQEYIQQPQQEHLRQQQEYQQQQLQQPHPQQEHTQYTRHTPHQNSGQQHQQHQKHQQNQQHQKQQNVRASTPNRYTSPHSPTNMVDGKMVPLCHVNASRLSSREGNVSRNRRTLSSGHQVGSVGTVDRLVSPSSWSSPPPPPSGSSFSQTSGAVGGLYMLAGSGGWGDSCSTEVDAFAAEEALMPDKMTEEGQDLLRFPFDPDQRPQLVDNTPNNNLADSCHNTPPNVQITPFATPQAPTNPTTPNTQQTTHHTLPPLQTQAAEKELADLAQGLLPLEPYTEIKLLATPISSSFPYTIPAFSAAEAYSA
jgi:hypothetical protein